MTAKKLAMPHPWVSWSQVDLWHKCPACYQARYYLKKKPQKTYDMVLGTAAHKAAEKINQLAMKGIELAPDDARVLARAAVMQYMPDGEIRPNDWVDLVMGLEQWAKEAFFRRKEMIGAEIECDIPYSADHNVVLKLKIDVAFNTADGGMLIYDFKNSRGITRKTDLLDSRQIHTYCYGMLERVSGLKKMRAGHWYFRHRSENCLDIDVERVHHVREWIDQALEGITSGEFPARVSSECGRCGLRGSCKEYASRYKGIKGGRPKDALDAHKKLDRVKKAIKLLELERDDLRDYIGDRADEEYQILVDSGSQAWYYRAKEKRIVPARAAIDLYAEHDVELPEYLTVKTTELDKQTKKVLRSLASKKEEDDFLKQLKRVTKVEKSTELVLGKPLPEQKKKTKPPTKKQEQQKK
jgi:hypothetical protein